MEKKKPHWFSTFLFGVAAVGFVITVLTAREVMQHTVTMPKFGDPGWRNDAMIGYVVYVATQFIHLTVIPLALGVLIEAVRRRP